MTPNYLLGLLKYDIAPITYSVNTKELVKTYSIVYRSNLVPSVDRYYIKYTSFKLIPIADKYTIAYTSVYGDSVQRYKIKYFSGRELNNSLDRYYLRYSTTYTTNLYDIYNIRYTTTGASSEAQRQRYRIKYSSESVTNVVNTYTIKYSTSTFYDNYAKYNIRYTSTGAEELLLRAALLRNDENTDAIIEIRDIIDRSLEEYLFVISNMPKYQTLEFRIGENLPYITYIPASDVPGFDAFEDDGVTSYEVRGYLLIKNIEDLNGISVDIYDIERDFKKINRSKTYFFGLEQTDYIETLVSLKGTVYYFLNRSSNYYNVAYLNYTSASITPTFRFGIDCCFSRKINKTNYSYCSPF